jgi:hypothetical protein
MHRQTRESNPIIPAAANTKHQHKTKTEFALLPALQSVAATLSHQGFARNACDPPPQAYAGRETLKAHGLTRKAPVCLPLPRGDANQQRTAVNQLLAKGTSMSEQTSYMAELDKWVEATIVGPLLFTSHEEPGHEKVVEQVKKAIRAKVLDSYRNGQQAGPRKAFRK